MSSHSVPFAYQNLLSECGEEENGFELPLLLDTQVPPRPFIFRKDQTQESLSHFSPEVGPVYQYFLRKAPVSKLRFYRVKDFGSR